MVCFCVRHLCSSQDCQMVHLYSCVGVYTCMHAHILLPIPASAFLQREGFCSHLILSEKGKLWEQWDAPWWGSTDSTYLQLQGFFSLWLGSMVSMFPIPSLSHVADKGCSYCHYPSSPYLLWEADWETEFGCQNTDIWNISTWQNDWYLLKIQFIVATIPSKQSVWQRNKLCWLIQTTAYYSTGSSCRL